MSDHCEGQMDVFEVLRLIKQEQWDRYMNSASGQNFQHQLVIAEMNRAMQYPRRSQHIPLPEREDIDEIPGEMEPSFPIGNNDVRPLWNRCSSPSA